MKTVNYLFLLVGLVFVGCSKSPLENESGTKLVSTQITEGDSNWEEFYTYDSFDKLIRVEDTRGTGEAAEIQYSDGKPVRITYSRIESNEILNIDSITYSASGKIEKLFRFSGNAILLWSNEFQYNSSGQLDKMLTFNTTATDPIAIERFTWKNGNITLSEILSDQGEVLYETRYSYDNKENYLKNKPFDILKETFWSANNVTKTDYDDSYSLIDRSCYVCSTDYKYNKDGYPVEIEFDWGRKVSLFYE